MEKTRFFAPYTEDGRTRLKRTGPGVYIIKKDGKIAYIGYSGSNVKKTMYRHFQKWTDIRPAQMRWLSAHERVTFHGEDRGQFSVRVIFTTPKRAEKIEQALILKHKPPFNSLKLELLTRDERREIEDQIFSAKFVSMEEEGYFYASTNETKENEQAPF